jgi:hypothetical protein
MIFILLSLVWKIKVGLCDLHAICVSVYSTNQLLNGWTTPYETYNVFRGTWAHVDGVFINPSH